MTRIARALGVSLDQRRVDLPSRPIDLALLQAMRCLRDIRGQYYWIFPGGRRMFLLPAVDRITLQAGLNRKVRPIDDDLPCPGRVRGYVAGGVPAPVVLDSDEEEEAEFERHVGGEAQEQEQQQQRADVPIDIPDSPEEPIPEDGVVTNAHLLREMRRMHRSLNRRIDGLSSRLERLERPGARHP